MKINEWKKILQMHDIYTIIMLVIYSLFSIILFSKLDNAIELLATNFAIFSVVLSVSYFQHKYSSSKALTIFRKVYLAPIVYLIYVQVQNYVQIINPNLVDNILIKWDQFIFGGNPTDFMHKISFPFLTEILQICYMLYFVMPLMVAIDLHLKKNTVGFDEFARMILFAFYWSYLMYFFMPAIGPRFTLHDFSTLNLEIPGLYLTEFLRGIVNNGGGIPIGHPDPASVVNRDCMPSGHTWITLTNMIIAFRYKSSFRWLVLIGGSGLILATVYLRYHYVVDVLAGAIFAGLTFWLEPKVRSFFQNKFKIGLEK